MVEKENKKMTETFAERLKKAMESSNVSIQELSDHLDVTYEMVRRYTLGIATPRTKKLEKMAYYLNISPSWLQFGRTSNQDGILLSELKAKLSDEWDQDTPLNKDEVEVPFYKSIELAAGQGSCNNEDYNGFKLRFSKSFFRRKGVQKENVICFPAHGNSMEPVIPNGATVAVDTIRKDIIDGDVYAMCQGGLCRLKRLYRAPGNKVRIVSYNAIDHPDEIDDLNNIEIIGRVFHYSVEL